MTRLDVRSADGTVTANVELDEDVFGVQPNVPLMHQVVTAQQAAARSGTQSTKTRAEVSGGGAKPYKQKGTGRARQGSTRAPHYAGGGVALGPKPRSYRQRTPRKMIQLALRCALSDRASSGRLMVVEDWEFDVPNTKAAKTALATLGISGRVMLVLSREDERAYKSFRNLPDVDLVLSGELAAYDILCSDWVVFTRRALPGHSTWSEAVAAPTLREPPRAPTGAPGLAGEAAPEVTAPEVTAPEVTAGVPGGDAPETTGDAVTATGSSGSGTATGGAEINTDDAGPAEQNDDAAAGEGA